MTSMTPHGQLPVRGNPHRRLLRALAAMGGGEAVAAIAAASHTPWASATFQGSRHLITLTLTGPDARERSEALRDSLPEADFRIPGHIVASISVDAVSAGTNQAILIDLSALTIEDW